MPDSSRSRNDHEAGLYRKYNVERLNDPTGKHADCTYYVLDLHHDKYAVDALLAYAKACEAEYPTLAFDLRHEAAATARRLGVTPSETASREAVIEEIAKHIEDAPLTYMGPDPGGIKDLKFLIVAAIRDMKGKP